MEAAPARGRGWTAASRYGTLLRQPPGAAHTMYRFARLAAGPAAGIFRAAFAGLALVRAADIKIQE